MIEQIISKDGKIKCITTILYPKNIIKAMKKAGYIIKEKEIKNETKQ